MYSMHKAKTHLSKLVRDALKGKEVIIARRNEPMVRLVPVRKPPKKRVPGSLKGKSGMRQTPLIRSARKSSRSGALSDQGSSGYARFNLVA